MLGIDTNRFRKTAKELKDYPFGHGITLADKAANQLREAADYIDDPTTVWDELTLDELVEVARKRGWLSWSGSPISSLSFTYSDGWFTCSSIHVAFYSRLYDGRYNYGVGPLRHPLERNPPPDLSGRGKTPRDALLDSMRKSVKHVL